MNAERQRQKVGGPAVCDGYKINFLCFIFTFSRYISLKTKRDMAWNFEVCNKLKFTEWIIFWVNNRCAKGTVIPIHVPILYMAVGEGWAGWEGRLRRRCSRATRWMITPYSVLCCIYKWSGLNVENRRENWKIVCAVSRIVVFEVMRQDIGG